MSDEKRQRNGIPADLQPYYDEPQNGTRAWARWLTRVLAAIIVVLLVVVFLRWFWNQTHKDTDSKKSSDDTSKIEKAESTDSDSNDSTASDSSSSNPSTATTTPTTPSTATPKPSTSTDTSSTSTGGNSAAATQTVGQSTQTSTLVNTGPGQTIAIFVAATLCFGLLYQLRLRQSAKV